MTMTYDGLYPKYEVYQDDEPLSGFSFVLRPETDAGARLALETYIDWCYANDFENLGRDLEDVLDNLDD